MFGPPHPLGCPWSLTDWVTAPEACGQRPRWHERAMNASLRTWCIMLHSRSPNETCVPETDGPCRSLSPWASPDAGHSHSHLLRCNNSSSNSNMVQGVCRQHRRQLLYK